MAGCSTVALVLTVAIEMAENNAERQAKAASNASRPKSSVTE